MDMYHLPVHNEHKLNEFHTDAAHIRLARQAGKRPSDGFRVLKVKHSPRQTVQRLHPLLAAVLSSLVK